MTTPYPVAGVLGCALSDAISYNDVPDDCAECAEAGHRCDNCAEDLDCQVAYRWLRDYLATASERAQALLAVPVTDLASADLVDVIGAYRDVLRALVGDGT